MVILSFFRPVMENTILQQQFEILFEKFCNRQVFVSFLTEAIHVYMIKDIHMQFMPIEFSISKGMDPYCSLPALSTYMGHKGIESTEYYLRLTKQYFVNVLNYTQEQADTIFPEV